jgi:two-component system CheB/CheR fusion protein
MTRLSTFLSHLRSLRAGRPAGHPEREPGEAAREESDARLRLAAQASGFGIHDYDALADRAVWSDELYSILGIPAGSVVRMNTIEAAAHPDDRERVSRTLRAALDPEGTGEFAEEFRIVRRDSGEVRWVFKRGRTFFADPPSGRIAVRNIGILIDITDRKRADERALAAVAKFEGVFNQSGIFAGIMDLEGRLREINDLAVDWCGYSRNEVLGLPFWETPWWRGSDESRARIRFATRQAASGTVFRDTLRYWLADGSERVVDFAMHPIRDQSGTVRFLHPTGIDVTERKRVEETLREADRRKDEFLAMLAHELRNPLTPIDNAAQMLRMVARDEPRIAMARDIIERQVSHMSRLIDDLLDVSRITRGLIELRRERLRISEVITLAVEASRAGIDAADHALAVDVGPEVWVLGDPARLVQVVTNLLGNAAKFTPRGGRISLCVTQENGNTAISVVDTGVGIPKEAQDRIFELFQQENVSLERAQGGLGIGLTLVKRLVEMHGGRVRVASDGPGKGTEFTVVLPTLDASAVKSPAEPRAAAPEPVRPLRVLIVEDHPDAAESFKVLLELRGHDVRLARDGLTALRVFEEFDPQVAFVDLGLPGIDGFEVARRVRADGSRRATLVALSGYGRDEDKRRAAAAGFDEHMTKPVDHGRVQELLRKEGERA